MSTTGRKRRKGVESKRGVALVMTLGAITVLTVFLTELQEETSSELSAALAERDALKAEYYAKSAVNLARLLIAAEPEIKKSIPILGAQIPQIPVWEFTDMVLGPFNDSTGGQSFSSLINADPSTGKNLGLTGGGHYELRIVDEESKININLASDGLPNHQQRLGAQLLGLFSSPAYKALFEGRDCDNQFTDQLTICGAIADWTDEDENLYSCDPFSQTASSAKGTEDNYYQILGLPYRRKNAPYDSLEELRQVRGMCDNIWSSFVDPDPSDPHKRVMTVWGQTGQVNLNTADALPIIAVICSDKNAAATACADPEQLLGLVTTINLLRGIMRGIPIITKTTDFVKALGGKSGPAAQILQMLGPALGVQLKPIVFTSESEVAKQFTLKSQFFSIYADGVVPGYRKTTKVRIHAVVDFGKFAPIPNATNLLTGGAGQQTAGGITPITPGGGALTGPNPQTDINPAGKVVYWRVE